MSVGAVVRARDHEFKSEFGTMFSVTARTWWRCLRCGALLPDLDGGPGPAVKGCDCVACMPCAGRPR